LGIFLGEINPGVGVWGDALEADIHDGDELEG
jgi:hypothetical protein